MLSIAVVLLAIAAPASAATIRSATSGTVAPQPWQTWIDDSRIPIPNWPLELHYQPCPDGWDACYGNDNLYVTPAIAPRDRRYVFLHELGHWFDDHALTNWDRLVFIRISHSAATEWVGDGDETFADAFAACAQWSRVTSDRQARITAFAPGPRTYRHVCQWIRLIASRPTAPALAAH